MARLIARLIINMLALAAAVMLVPGIHFAGDRALPLGGLLIVAFIFGLINAVIKPLLVLVTCPFYILTLGLFTFVVNALMLMLTGWLAGPRFVVAGFWPALWGSIIISIVSMLMSLFLAEEERQAPARRPH